MVVVLVVMLGQIGLLGGGFGFGWYYNGVGMSGCKGIILSGFFGLMIVLLVYDSMDYKGYSSIIFIVCFMDVIFELGKIINWNGKLVKLLLLKMCVFVGINLFY